jgi:hypothetical protein
LSLTDRIQSGGANADRNRLALSYDPLPTVRKAHFDDRETDAAMFHGGPPLTFNCALTKLLRSIAQVQLSFEIGQHCAHAGNARGRQLRRPCFLLIGLRREARKIGYNIFNPMILLFLQGRINFDAVVEYFRISGRRNFLGKNSHWLLFVTEEDNVQLKLVFRFIHIH